MAQDRIIIRGARENNLKNVSVSIPRDKLILFTGLSGSGKTALAFDTIFADGQRRYMESLSSYARQFLGQMRKPDVDEIRGLSPAISIDQKTTSRNPRSTVGTVTEIYDYLRLLYARIGVPHCPVCGREIRQQTVDQMADRILRLPEGTRIRILAPVVRDRKGGHQKELEAAKRSGYVRIRADGVLYDLTDSIPLDKNRKHTLEIVVDRLIIRPDIRSRLAGSLEAAAAMAGGLVLVDVVGDRELLFSQNYSCPDHGVSMEELTPGLFSFNNPAGACPTCTGLGVFQKIDPDLLIRFPDRTIREGAFRAAGWSCDGGSVGEMYFEALHRRYGLPLDTPVGEMTPEELEIVFYGTKGEKMEMVRNAAGFSGTYVNDFEGIVPNLERRFRETNSEFMRYEIAQYMSAVPCPDCHGDRLKPELLAVTVGGVNISDFCRLSIDEADRFLGEASLTGQQREIGASVIREIRTRLQFLKNVGLSYLTLSRPAGTLSGGESQRIRLATQIGSSLMGVLYILDEPSIGLHQRDNGRLIGALKRLRDLGNTVIVVEHDEETIRSADYVVDVGPGAGIRGGEIVFSGTVPELLRCGESVTGRYLSGELRIPVPETRKRGNGCFLEILGAAEHNLKNIDVRFPLGTMIAVTGVSGSGKSSLVNEILYKSLASRLTRSRLRPGKHREIRGAAHLDKVISIDQAPIGRTPRSNPATYTGVFTDIRELFASTNEAKARGYRSGRFSFNIPGGRCEACQGDGILQIPMHFLPDVYVPCEVCRGKRYNRETLEVRYRGKNIHDVLEMTVEEALIFFGGHLRIRRKLQTLADVGLGYIRLGQPATTLSGGEAQRVKLAAELSRRSTGRTIYILDEPTTGLHTDDVRRLLGILTQFTDGGNTVVVIEHNLDVIKSADYVIDLGPEGGDGGGSVVAAGTPEEIADCPASHTGRYLKKTLARS